MAERFVVLAVVRRCAWYLKYASSKLRADREVVMAAVTKSGQALEYASPELRADREVVLAAIEHDASCLRYASNALQCSIVRCWLWCSIVPQCTSIQNMLQHVPAELQASPISDRLEVSWPVAMKWNLARDRDALGAAVGVRNLPAPHATLNGAPEALALVHCLVARRVEAMNAVELRPMMIVEAIIGSRAQALVDGSTFDGLLDVEHITTRILEVQSDASSVSNLRSLFAWAERNLPAPHATLNGAPEALALVHCLVARRVEAMNAVELRPMMIVEAIIGSRAQALVDGSTFDGLLDVEHITTRILEVQSDASSVSNLRSLFA